MSVEDYGRQLGEFERVLQDIATNIAGGAVFERLPPEELWAKAEGPVTRLRTLAEVFREGMLTLKPERTAAIEGRFEALSHPLSAFKTVLFQKTGDPLANTGLALEQLRKAVAGGSDLLALAKEIRETPSPAIRQILQMREVSESKDYLATVQAPQTLQTRLIILTRHMVALEAALNSLEGALNDVRQRLATLQEESRRFRSEPTEAEDPRGEPAAQAGGP